MKRPNLPGVEAYTHRQATKPPPYLGKSIVNPRYVRNVGNAHKFALWRGETLDLNRIGFSGPDAKGPPNWKPTYDPLRINHYWSRSIEDLTVKVERGDSSYNLWRDLAYHIKAESELNEVEDKTILPIWREIRERTRPRRT